MKTKAKMRLLRQNASAENQAVVTISGERSVVQSTMDAIADMENKGFIVVEDKKSLKSK